jgi:hypothetical protein
MSYSYLNEVWDRNDPMKKISKKIAQTMEQPSEKLRTEDLLTNESTDFFDPTSTYSIVDTSTSQGCSDFFGHIKSCRKCQHRLKAFLGDQQVSLAPEKDDWKETLIIIVGAVIIIMLLFMMGRQFSK